MTRPRTDATLSSGASRSRRLRRLGRLGGGLAIGALVLSILSLDTAQGQVHPIDGLKAGSDEMDRGLDSMSGQL